ncbi:Dcp1-like decapping family-domain-containing protein [Gloeopeniophorella convolvens]|nr:Dcp1-like decapping family-domain-containing protein [Gloeopeniophorella convolvens]
MSSATSTMKSSRRSRAAPNGTPKRSKAAPVSPPKAQVQSESSLNHSPAPKSQVPHSTSVTAESRYKKNIKSLRRIDPTIVSIIDQFSHICLYRLHERKWVKDGYEGASFLFERSAYPPYGLFILNRAGMHDYIHLIYPEDEIQPEGEYLMYRSYPEFTAKRLVMAKSAPPSLTESWNDARRRTPTANDPLTNWRFLLNQKEDKGRYETAMFWFLGSDSEEHEPLCDTMQRLMTFIRKGEPYPYNLDRPPPPISHADKEAPQDASASDVSISATTTSVQSNGAQVQTATINGAPSELDMLFSKFIPASSSTPISSANGKVTLETLFASVSNSSTPAPGAAATPLATATKGVALLDSIFASATPSQGDPLPTPAPSFPHHVSSEPFPPPPSAPPSTRLSFAQAHPRNDPSSSEPESSDPPSPTPHAAAHLIHSPQPTTSQLPQILTQDVISALLGIPPSRTSSVASSHRRYEGDVESSDDQHDTDSPVDGRLHPSAARGRKHELGDVTPRPPLRGFASSEKVLPTPAMPSLHSAPAILPTAASSMPAVPPAPPLIAAPASASPAPRMGTSPAPRTLVPFHEESSLWPYPRAPVDDRDDIVELDFADTSALSDVDAFERRRRNGNGNGNGKHARKDRAREREEIERSWDVPGHMQSATPPAPSPVPAPAPAPLAASERPKGKSKHAANGTNAKTQAPAPAPAPASAPASTPAPAPAPAPAPTPAPAPQGALAKAAASTAIVEAVRAHTNGNAPPPNGERNVFVREVLTLIHTDPAFVQRLWEEYRARA